MVLVLQCAQRVRDALDRVGLAVGPVVDRVDAPLIARALVRGLADPVHDGIAQVDVARRHVDLRAQRLAALVELAAAHPLQEVEALGDGTVAIGALGAGLRERSTDRKSTRLNSSHANISYAVFCLKK